MRRARSVPLLFLALACGSAQAATGVQGSLVHALEATPGQTLHVPISLSNTGSTAETVRIGIEDVRVLPGGTTYLQPGQQDRSNALWVKLPAAALTVPANSTRSVNVVITVPPQAAPGAHWSALIVQPDRPPGAGSGGVVVNTRYAINLITTLPGGAPRIRMASPTLERTADGVRLGVQVFNDGSASSVPQYRAEVYDAQGRRTARAEVDRKRLYPGGGVQVDFRFGKLAAGRYTVVVMANDGVHPVTGTRYTVDVEN